MADPERKLESSESPSGTMGATIVAAQSTAQLAAVRELFREYAQSVSYTHLTLPTICSV